MKTKIALIAATGLLIGCSSTPKNTRAVIVENPQTISSVQSANFVTTASPDHAAASCETDDMRRKVLDGNSHNDTVRIKVVEDNDTGSRILSQVEIDCRDYFFRKSASPARSTHIQTAAPTIIQTAAPTIEHIEPERRIIRNSPQRYSYIVQRGDTVWGIARQHCTTAKAISRLNGLGRGNVIDIDQHLKLPDDGC